MESGFEQEAPRPAPAAAGPQAAAPNQGAAARAQSAEIRGGGGGRGQKSAGGASGASGAGGGGGRGAASGSGITAGAAQDKPKFPPGFNPVAKAKQLHDAMDGWGTDERAIMDVLYTGRRDLTRAIQQAYDGRYSPGLEDALRSELSGDDLRKALQLLNNSRLTLRDKVREAVKGWGTDEGKIFDGLERANPSELAELRKDKELVEWLRSDLSSDDFQLVQAYLRGQGQLAASLRRSIAGWGTDEEEMWRQLDKASPEERRFVLQQPKLMAAIRKDLGGDDWLRCQRMLRGTLTNVDRIEIAMKGAGTDEAALMSALSGLTAGEFGKLPPRIDDRLSGELSGKDLLEAKEILHQKRLQFDEKYKDRWLAEQEAKLGEGAAKDEGSSVLLAKQGGAMSPVARIRAACKGAGTDDEDLWSILAGLTSAQGSFILRYDPDGVLGILRSDLSDKDYRRATTILRGGAGAATAVIREAVDGIGTNERLLYDVTDRIIGEGVAAEILADRDILNRVRADVSKEQYSLFVQALQTGTFTGRMRLRFATKMAGTDEDMVFEVCQGWRTELGDKGQIHKDVDDLLKAELSTRDYWRATDAIRGEPQTEEEKLAHAKTLLERERGGISSALMDSVSHKGGHADDAFREYQASYNDAYADGKVSPAEHDQLRADEAYSKRKTAEYREAKASVAQWASQIAVAIVGIVATILTAGAAGPFVAALSAALGGKVAIVAEAMILAAAMKVGINKAIEGEGYDLTSAETLVDAVGASVEVGLNVVGGAVAGKMMEGLGKLSVARSIGPAVDKIFGGAGRRILAAGLEGSIDGAIGGVGEGVFRGLADEKSWERDLGGFFSNVGATTVLHGGMGTLTGGAGAMLFKSIGEAFGPMARKTFGKPGSADHVLAGHADELADSKALQDDLFAGAAATNKRMQGIADEVADEVGVPHTPMGIKGNKPGVDVADMDQDKFIGGVLEKNSRKNYKQVGDMADMSRGRFDLDAEADVDSVAFSLRSRLEKEFGPENIEFVPKRGTYKRYHIVVKDAATGVSHEFQIGTKALTEFIEGQKIKLPAGVQLHAAPDFHTVVYDTLDNLSNPDVTKRLGLGDGFADEMGYTDLKKRFDALMIEAGSTTKGQPLPPDFQLRHQQLADEIGEVAARVEAHRPGLLESLDSKLAKVDDASRAAKAVPEEFLSYPEGPGDVVRKTQTDPQPGLRPDHAGSGYEDFPKAKAFLSGDDGSPLVDPTTVKQGALGDCYFIAGAASTARADPSAIPKLIKDNGDGTFDVTLYLRENRFAEPKPVTRTIDAQLPVKAPGQPLYAKVGRSTDEGDEVWMALLEKRLAMETGSYDQISGGNIGKNVQFRGVSELLTGKAEKYISVDSQSTDELLEIMDGALTQERSIMVGSRQFDKDPKLKAAAEAKNVFGNHAYSVVSVDLERKIVNLQNPWGSRHVTDLSIDDFKRMYSGVRVGGF